LISSARWPESMLALRIQQFRLLFAGNIAFFFVVQGQLVTRVFLAWELTHQETALASISVVVAIPMLLCSAVSGAVTDRFNRQKLIIIGQTVLLANESAVLVLLIMDALEFWHLLCFSFVAGCTFPFISPARMAIMFDIVGTKYFSNAMALSIGVVNLSRVAGPAVMGVVLDIFDVETAYMLAVGLHIVAILCMFTIRTSQPRPRSDKPLFVDIVEGFHYVFHHKSILICMIFGMLMMILAMPVRNMFVVFADEVWMVGERGFGIMIAASGVGGLIGSVWMARRSNSSSRVKMMVGSTLAFGVLLFLFSLSPVFSLAVGMLILANIFASASQTLNHTIALLLADENLKGRVSGFLSMSFGFMPLGVLPLAFAAEKVGIAFALAGSSVVLIIVAAGFYLLSPILRNLDQAVNRSSEI